MRLSILISPRNFYNLFKSIKEKNQLDCFAGCQRKSVDRVKNFNADQLKITAELILAIPVLSAYFKCSLFSVPGLMIACMSSTMEI